MASADLPGTTKWLAPELVASVDRDAEAGAAIRLAAGRCSLCGRNSFPATGTCTWCGAATTGELLLANATAIAVTAVLHPTPNAVVPVPYVVAIARFDAANLDVLGRVLDVSEPGELPVGAALYPVADRLADGRFHYAYAARR